MASLAAKPVAAVPDLGRPGPAAGALRIDQNLLDLLEKSTIAAYREGRVTVRRRRPAGCFVYGPYWQLPAGHYRLRFCCAARRPRLAGEPVLGVEIIVANRVQLMWRDFTAAELAAGPASLMFAVPARLGLGSSGDGRIEFRFLHLGNADLILSAIDLEACPDPAAVPEAGEWRMLGRLRKDFRGRRCGDGAVRVWRRAPAGRLLYGGWPYLRLPRGRYRLTVRAHVGRLRRPAEPVLALEAIAPRRWRDVGQRLRSGGAPVADTPLWVRLEIGADRLAAGQAALEFDVPECLSLEAGADAPFELRLHHFANADLTVSAVDLHRIGDARGRPSPPLLRANRAKIVIIGNCQADLLRRSLSRIPALSRYFEIRYHFVLLSDSLHEYAARDLEEARFILAQDLRDWRDFPLRGAIGDQAEIIEFPGLRFASPWPFDGWNGPGDREAHAREWPNLTFAYLDSLLGRLRREIPDREQRFAAYRRLAIPGIPDPRRLHDFEARRLAAMDAKFDVQIGAFVLDNFRSRRLFHTTVSPGWRLLDMLLDYLLRRLDIRTRARLPRRLDRTLRDPQVPVHPQIAAALGVRWAHERTRYAYAGRMITWEKYIRSYIDHYG